MWRVVIEKGVLSVFIQHFQVIVQDQANCVMYFVTEHQNLSGVT